MKKNSVWLVLATSFLNNGFAGGLDMPYRDLTWVTTISAGAGWENAGQTQTIFLTPAIVKTYAANFSTNAFFDSEIFAGVQKIFSPYVQEQLGIALAATSNANPSGMIWDDASPEFENYTYNYEIQHSHLALKSKILFNAGKGLLPWISGSLGMGFNNAHAFNNNPIIFQALPTPNFSANTTIAFTYTIGAGIQKVLSENCQVGIGYEFADWGSSQLRPASGQLQNSGLFLNHLYTNGVLVNFTYLA